MKAYKTYLPVFTGFYNTIFEPSDCDIDSELDYINDSRKNLKKAPLKDADDLEFEYKEFELNTATGCVDYVETILKDLGLPCKITNEVINSPKYYNFANDSINIDIEIDLDLVKSYLVENLDLFTIYIKDKYTSCSGFISSYSNDATDWLKFEIDNNTDHCIGSCLDFIIKNEVSEPEMDMYYNIADNYLLCSNANDLIQL